MANIKAFFQKYWIETLAGILMVLGLFFSFYHFQLGGALVGLSIGFYFAPELELFFNRIRFFYANTPFKALMIAGLFIYLLLVAPGLILGAAIGYAIMALLRRNIK